MQAFGIDDEDSPGPNVAFFKEWSQHLGWEDQDMIGHLLAIAGIRKSFFYVMGHSHSHTHHTGTRHFMYKANEANESDTSKGW